MTFQRKRSTSRWCLLMGIQLALASVCPTPCKGSDPRAGPPTEAPTLAELLEAYFRAADPDERASMVRSIEEATAGDLTSVADAMSRLQLWSAPADQTGKLSLKSGGGDNLEVTFRLPENYDPKGRHGLILARRRS